MSDNVVDQLHGAVVDGGMTTVLQQRGLTGGTPGELWNVDNPDAILAAHRAYADAGATVLTTNTWGGTIPRLDGFGHGARTGELNLAGAQLARSVADETADRDGRRVLVAGGVGPTGELLEPHGDLTSDGARILFADQLSGLADGGIDLWLIETLSDLAELRAAVEACRAVDAALPIMATMSFETNRHTMMGVAPAEAVQTATELELTAVGANCGNGPEEMEQVMTGMTRARADAGAEPDAEGGGLLLLAQTNAGLPQLDGGRLVYALGPAELAEHSVRLRHLGVDVVGTCCGSTPAHTAAIRAALTP